MSASKREVTTIPGFQDVEKDDESAYTINYGAHKEGMTPEDVAQYYNKWAQRGTYEEELCPGRYNGPTIVSKALARYCTDGSVRVLDVAAGTGLVGQKLAEHGYNNVDAIDAAQSMLDEARQKGIYKKYTCGFLGPEPTSLSQDTYDAIVISGGMGEGHIPCSAIWEMIRVTKPGGLVLILMRQEYLSYVAEYKDRLEPLMEKLEEAGLWHREEKTVVPSYSFQKNGVLFVHRVQVEGCGPDNRWLDFQ